MSRAPLPDFNANEYANAVLSGEPYPQYTHPNPGIGLPAVTRASEDSPAKEDISLVISKLTSAIDDVSKQIKNVVICYHENLFSQAASANDLSGSLTSVRSGLNDLDSSLEKLRLKIRVPYQTLQANLLRLESLQQTSDVLRRASRFVILARRLRLQMAEMENVRSPDGKMANGLENQDILVSPLLRTPDIQDEEERTIGKAALSIAELELLASSKNQMHVNVVAVDDGTESTEFDISLRSINAISAHLPFIEEAREKVTTQMESMTLTALNTLNQSLLSSSLQAAYNLRVLPELVQSSILDITLVVEDKIHNGFDLSKISKDALATGTVIFPQLLGHYPDRPDTSPPIYRSRVRTEPTNITAPQFTAALWSRIEVMIEGMVDCCIKVYTLEKVLKVKKDATTEVLFLEEVMKSLENKPSAAFWTSLGRSLEKHARDSAKSSTFLQQTLSNGYPKLLRLFQEFFAKIAVHTDTMYGPSYQSPETVFILRSLSVFESQYLSRSSSKLNETVAQAFSGGIRAPPGYNEGINIARTVANEVDSARFDPLLVKSVMKSVVSSLDMFLSRVDGMVIQDRSATTLVGPAATPQQISNAQLATCLYQCWFRLEKLKGEQPEASSSALQTCVQNIYHAYENLVEPLNASVRREFGAIISKLHRVDFGQAVDSMSGMGVPSLYMKELVEKLSFVKAEVLNKFSIGEAGRVWLISIVRFVIRTFVLHVSITRPLTESGKLQLTSDMTELEFALSTFMVENPQSKRGSNLGSIGDDYRALRAMRPLLFLDNTLLADTERTDGLSPLIVLHHIIVRSPMPLPHELHGWQEAEYVRWVDEHTETEAWTLIEGGLAHWEKVSESEGQNGAMAKGYIELARTVLRNTMGY